MLKPILSFCYTTPARLPAGNLPILVRAFLFFKFPLSFFSDEEDSVATQLESSHLVEIVTKFLSRPTRRFSGFIPNPPVHERDGSCFPSPNFQGVYPNSSLPTITPGSMRNPTLSTKIPVNYRHSLTQENLPTNQQQDNLTAQSELDSSVNKSRLDFLNNCLISSALPLSLSFLQDQIPDGLGFSSNCQIWLDKLHIKNWDEFVHLSSSQTIEGLMSWLSVPFYNQHRKDLREFLIFGMIGLDSLSKCYPNYKNSCLWMTGHIFNLRTGHILNLCHIYRI